jgi:hypothetical protein
VRNYVDLAGQGRAEVDGNRFERLSRAMEPENTRRGLLRTFVGGLAAAVFGTAVAAEPSHADLDHCYTQLELCRHNCVVRPRSMGHRTPEACWESCNAQLVGCLR